MSHARLTNEEIDARAAGGNQESIAFGLIFSVSETVTGLNATPACPLGLHGVRRRLMIGGRDAHWVGCDSRMGVPSW